MRRAVHSMPPPIPVTVNIVKYKTRLGIRVYADQVMKHSHAEQLRLLKYLGELQTVLESFGAKVQVEGHERLWT